MVPAHKRYVSNTRGAQKACVGKLRGVYVEDWGRHKIIFGIHRVEFGVVLKVGSHRNIESDHRPTKRFLSRSDSIFC